jgi:hypothetical protein
MSRLAMTCGPAAAGRNPGPAFRRCVFPAMDTRARVRAHPWPAVQPIRPVVDPELLPLHEPICMERPCVNPVDAAVERQA